MTRSPFCFYQSLAFAAVSPDASPANPPPPPTTESEKPDAHRHLNRTSSLGQIDVPTTARPVIVAFGDSLTAGYGAGAGESYPDYLQRDLDQAGYHYRVANLGVSGNTTKDGVDRLKDVLALKPKVVIVAFGGNDGLRGLPIDATRKNLDRSSPRLPLQERRSFSEALPSHPTTAPTTLSSSMKPTRCWRRSSTPRCCPFFSSKSTAPGSMQADGIHATAQGNQQVAQNLLPLVTPLC